MSPSPTVAPSAAPSPVTARWIGFQRPIRDVVFGADGSIYVSEWEPGVDAAAIHRLNEAGDEQPGWPVEVQGSPTLVMDEDWILASVCPADRNVPCELHRYRADGTQEAGWPVTTTAGCFSATAAWHGAVLLVCSAGDDALLVAADRGGLVTDGWPLTLRGLRSVGSVPGSGLYATSVPEPGRVSIDLLTQGGRSADGWPISLDGASDRYGTFGVIEHPGGFLVAWWMEGVTPDSICLDAELTTLAAIGPDGRAAPGWPVSVDGFGSPPVADRAGRIWMRVDGPRSMIVGFDPSGTPLSGWPVDLPPDACAGADGSAAVHLLSDGSPVVVQDGQLHAFRPDGSRSPGWPASLGGGLPDGCLPEGCTPGSNQVLAPFVDARGTLYATRFVGTGADVEAQLMAWGSDGQPLAGWPISIPRLPCYPAACPFPVPRIWSQQLTPAGTPIVVAAEGLFLVR